MSSSFEVFIYQLSSFLFIVSNQICLLSKAVTKLDVFVARKHGNKHRTWIVHKHVSGNFLSSRIKRIVQEVLVLDTHLDVADMGTTLGLFGLRKRAEVRK